MRLVLIRHGQTAWNAERRFQGHADPPLDDIGRKQATEVAAALGPLRPGLILTSDLRRARSTAAPLAEVTGAAVVADAALREVDLGGWEGLDHAEVQARYPEEYRAWKAGLPVRRGGGETEAEAGTRAAGFITAQLEGCHHLETGTVAVVAHGIVLRAAMARLAEDRAIDLGGPSPHLDNGAWRCFTWRP